MLTRWIADLFTGTVIGSVGFVVLRRRRRDLVGWLLVATAATWFLGSVAELRTGPTESIGLAVQFLHRAVLVHAVISALLALPAATSKPIRRTAGYLLVAAGYLVSLVREWAMSVVPTLALAVVIALAVLLRARQDRDQQRLIPWATTALGMTVWAGAATIGRWLPALTADGRLVFYEIGLIMTAVGVARRAVRLGS